MLATTLQYELNIPILIGYLGGNYTGEYRNSNKTIRILKEANCGEQIIKDLQ